MYELFPHQKNMVNAINYIRYNGLEFKYHIKKSNNSNDENNSFIIDLKGKYSYNGNHKYLIINDKIGSGKSLTSLCSIDLNKNNIIFVPPHLYSQWKNEIKKFLDENDFIFINRRSQITNIKPTNVKTYLIRLTMAYTLSQFIKDNPLDIDTVIIDELFNNKFGKIDDNLYNLLFKTAPLTLILSGDKEFNNNKFVSCLDKMKKFNSFENNFIFSYIDVKDELNKVMKKKTNFEVYFNNSTYFSIVSPPELLDKCFQTIKISEYIILCDVDKFIQEAMNKYESFLNVSVLNTINNSMKILTSEDMIKALIKHYETSIVNLTTHSSIIQCTNKITRLKDLLKDNTCPICLDDVNNPVILTCCDKSICKDCINSWINTNRYMSITCPCCREKLSENIIAITDVKQENKYSKLGTIKELIKSNKKTLIFSDDSTCLEYIKKLLNSVLITGRISEKNIKLFNNEKSSKIKILCLNSNSMSTGLNLVATDRIIFYHVLPKKREIQAIGRALRLNRTKELEIIHLIHNDIENYDESLKIYKNIDEYLIN